MSTAIHTDTDLEIAPVAGYLGAEISGVDIGEPLSESVANQLRSALWRPDPVLLDLR